jgi:hypothetical protein
MRNHLASLESDLADLFDGTGRWTNTPEGAAARSRNGAAARLRDAQRIANDPSSRRRDRRAASRSLDGLREEAAAADELWQSIGQPAAGKIERSITQSRSQVETLQWETTTKRLDKVQRPAPGRAQAGGLSL